MDPINLITAINLFVSISANWSGAKKGIKTSLTKLVERPKSYLQKVPPNISALILIITILGIFDIGSLPQNIKEEYANLRIIGLLMFIIFSWVQVLSFKSLKSYYSQDVVILKEHKLITKGIYGFVRHPQYISQILSDFGAGLALMNFLIMPLAIFVELPLFMLRAKLEEKMLADHFGEEFKLFKKKSGFIFPFIG
ncbi:MAG: isoprenylcysteine carboxylmethyltransferase family protein [Melioribacteraceae bacterium]|nr:isoprenylcysteine carboxylmethyltransferase family protein [Melioribacteraceae bacterium]